MNKIFIIAEAGVNHNGSLKIAKELIDAAASAGVDAVKFQAFKAETLACMSAPKAGYQKKSGSKNETQFQMLKKLELSCSEFLALSDYCKKRGVLFILSPFDCESIEFIRQLGLSVIKIPSGEINNLPYLKKAGILRKKIIISTGMSGLGEVRAGLEILLKAGTRRQDITVLQCNTDYPTRHEDVNLLAMLTMKDILKVNVGVSDHTLGLEVPVAAAALGASVIEKHFTLKRSMKGPDHKASLEPAELKEMVRAIRNTEKALGSAVKKPTAAESRNKLVVRKSITAAKDIRKGEVFTEDNLTVKRPGTGISPMKWEDVIGKISGSNFKKDEIIKL